MLSIQHILHSLYTYDMTYLHRYGASVVYPDAIRAYVTIPVYIFSGRSVFVLQNKVKLVSSPIAHGFKISD